MLWVRHNLYLHRGRWQRIPLGNADGFTDLACHHRLRISLVRSVLSYDDDIQVHPEYPEIFDGSIGLIILHPDSATLFTLRHWSYLYCEIHFVTPIEMKEK